MRLLQRMFGQHRGAAHEMAPFPPAPPAIPARERAELARTRRRLEPKWAAIDGLIADFERGDDRLRLGRR